ncbi:MAG: TonB-dependent receptor [Opitutaceae bacterium]|nr:TonB-dependent receptor [Opitutaceae bacterium]
MLANRRRPTCCLLAAAMAAGSVVAAEDESIPVTTAPPVQLPSFEVTGSPIAAAPETDRFATSVTTIRADQLQEIDALDFASALRRTPGVTITRYNQIGAFGGAEGGAVFLRGLGASRPGSEIKTLVDGVPKLNGVFNHPLLDLMSVDLAAQIDVHLRATPLAFGNTFAAVNMVTPRVASPGQITCVTAAAGSYGTIVERLDQGAKIGAFDYYLSQSFRRSDGDRADADGRLENYFLRLGWALSSRWQLSYVLNHTSNRATDPGAEGAAAGSSSTRGEIYETADWLHIAALTHRHAGAEGSLRAYLNDGEGNWYRQFSGNADSLNDWRLYGVRWRESLRPWAGGEIAAGADLDYERGTSRSVPPAAAEKVFGPETMRLFSAYAGLNHTFAPAAPFTITPSAGARYYHHDQFGPQWAPQAGLLVSASRTQWHVGWNRAVNYPGLEVAAISSVIANPALGQSWRALRPEEADQFEAGVRYRPTAITVVTVTVYRNNARNRYVVVPPPPPPPQYLNIGSYHTEGVEATAEIRPGRNLALFAGLSLLRASIDDLPYAPKHSLSGGFNWRFASDWFLRIDGEYTAAMHVLSEARSAGTANPTKVGARFLLNARLARRFAWGAHRVEVYLSGENLTDRNFAYRPGYPIAGASFLAGVRLEW